MPEIVPAIGKIAKVLRIDADEVLAPACARLEDATGQRGVIEHIVEDAEARLIEKLVLLGVERTATAQEVYDALLSKVEADDLALWNLFRQPDYTKPEGYKTVLSVARETAGIGEGFFLKHEKASEFLKAEPPAKILQALGYASVDELLAKEDLLEIYSALRFLEGSDWLNEVFFKQYETLTPADFEKRSVELRVISPRWVEAAQKFVTKKHHNLSHLKELGVIFVIPWSLGVSGETLRMFSLLLHYLHEIEFYSMLFERFATTRRPFAEKPHAFAEDFIASLRGDIAKGRPRDVDTWLIVQRYLAKDDENDWRLFWPHVNPEALHWQRAEKDLVRLGSHFNLPGLLFWHDLDWLGGYFKTETGVETLVSFDLVDTVMSLVKKTEQHKYLYHQQEALWNKIFGEYLGEEEMRRLIVENFEAHEIRVTKGGRRLAKIRRAFH